MEVIPERSSVSQTLDNRKKRIMTQWADRVTAKLPAAQLQDRLALLDALPELMDSISNALKRVGFSTDGRKELAKEHALQRSTLEGYTIGQVLTEMRILRETIFEVLEEDGPLPTRERDIIIQSVEKGIVSAGSEFMRLHIEEKNQQLASSNEVVKQIETELYESFSTIEKLESEQGLRDLFVSALTHDLRTPLTAGKLSLQLLRKDLGDPDRALQLIARIEKSINRTNEMIETLLDANQMRAGQALVVNMSEYDICHEVAEIILEQAEIHGSRFILECSERPILVHLGKEKVNRAVENLISNAVKYGDPGTQVAVSIKKMDNEVQIAVHNIGRPIGEDDRASIFEPFFRAKTVRFGNKKGWGLGLTLVRGIAEAHSGWIELKSNSHDGTTFTLHLPLKAKH